METNLLTHRIVTIIQDFAHPQFQGDEGFGQIAALLNEGLSRLGSNVTVATVSDFRKLYHDDWRVILNSVCPASYQELLNDRYKQLVF
jgi:hypothetical protein